MINVNVQRAKTRIIIELSDADLRMILSEAHLIPQTACSITHLLNDIEAAFYVE
jgi:hypothetical protein